MFATIQTICAPENFWGKLKYNLLPPAVQCERISPDEGSDFLRLRVPVVRGKICWSNVQNAAGSACRFMLAPGDAGLQERVAFKRFESERFVPLLTFNSFVNLLSLLPQKRLLQECALIDFSASFVTQAAVLPRYCRTLKIITANAQKYAALSTRAMHEYGCAVMVSTNSSKAFESQVVLLPKAPAMPLAFSRGSLVFASGTKNIYTPRLLTPEGVSLPRKYLELMPGGISPTEFAAALYEISGVAALGKSICPAFRQNNRILSYQDVISMLDY